MKRKAVSLQKSLSRKLIMFGSILVVFMVGIITVQYIFGIDTAADVDIQIEAISLSRQLEQQNELTDVEVSLLSNSNVYRHWEKLPEYVKTEYQSPDTLILNKPESKEAELNGELIYLELMKLPLASGEIIYWLGEYSSEYSERYFEKYIKIIVMQSLIAIAVFMLLLFALVAWWMRSLGKPFVHLKLWAEKLGTEQQQPKSVYDYEELNDLAEQLESAVERISAYNQRETQFLRNASHELRTPLAIMQASLDTLDEQIGESRPLNRAKHAVENMTTLSRTILWLARESKEELEVESVSLRQVSEELITRLDYLKQHKQLSVSIKGEGSCLVNPALIEIVMSNLIRNAFQYAEQGEISIFVSDETVTVSNHSSYQGDHSSGFGLGLELVKRICAKQGWRFCYQNSQQEVQVEVIFTRVC
ncbi:HAMP domain-containing sensor histidine kinase [Vibrio sp. 99-8-1]|uniref:sensor histidine kinase n=1 Tax=Vibrio sp. 99-8-1 TaxID=2607602 RepID=UPI00149374A7|nr:HAMP domain-containing sensor histidine kinase [Vibrio sp. 99-8-1]NOI68040.1 HAMP domain-containing histidine kinase [Vibrio sp. 99-8-1]